MKIIKQYDDFFNRPIESHVAAYVLYDATDHWKWMIVSAGWSNELGIHTKSYVKTMPRNWTMQ